ncbi:MAG: indolepyruvate ferredoxin oxidoreductase subunit alpha [Betaproteobacteria bacterium]|jgi:indolepyruvate ferredoxin oxidoreductase, alpha subunit
MEISFEQEIELLKLGQGEVFHGEGILAITKALLQSGVAYIGGYQGAPVSHLLDVMVQAKDYVDELGVHVEACSNEASAAAMLGASIHYPLRGAVTWKSIVGTNVAADALSNLSSPGVKGGALIVVGADFGEGASVIQERTHAFALKSTMLMIDPRPELSHMVDMVEHAFQLSEASNMPAIFELRIRACHMRGSFVCKNNISPKISTKALINEPAKFNYDKLAHPPVTFVHEKRKIEERIPAARKYIEDHALNELKDGRHQQLGLIVQGGLYNTLIKSLQLFGLADEFGETDIPTLILNVTSPLVPSQIAQFASGKEALIVIEEGTPEYIEQEISLILRRRGLDTVLHGKDFFSITGEMSTEQMTKGLIKVALKYLKDVCTEQASTWLSDLDKTKAFVAQMLPKPLPPRPPGFCIGCPERPVFSALKLAQEDIGPVHIAADIGCHAFGTFAPFSFGHSILGYGMSLASRAGISPMMQNRTLSIMGDGGFWHNGLLTGVQSALFNQDDAVLLIFKNGYTSATGTQDIWSTPSTLAKKEAIDKSASLVNTDQSIEKTLQGMGVQWLKVINTYEVALMKDTIKAALTSDFYGLKVIIAEGECQLERQRRIKPWISSLLKKGKRVVRVKYGVDEDVCTGDHACIRLSGCPTLTLKDNPDPLKVDPVATVIDGCVGCGLCGENAHVATLCPSFYRAEVIQNPTIVDRFMGSLRSSLIQLLQAH